MNLEDNLLYRFDREHGDVIGVDEAGRGPLAGPVVATAAIFRENISMKTEDLELILEINDSKKLSEVKRERLFEIIKRNFYVGVGIVDNLEIDRINILNGTFLAMRKALSQLETLNIGIKNKMVLVDGNHKIREYDGSQKPVIKGDSKSLSIAAASIIAKVTRDNIMKELEEKYPQYEFHKHKGYGTKRHRDLILEYGPCEIHRKSFLKKILQCEDIKESSLKDNSVKDRDSEKIENGKLF